MAVPQPCSALKFVSISQLPEEFVAQGEGLVISQSRARTMKWGMWGKEGSWEVASFRDMSRSE